MDRAGVLSQALELYTKTEALSAFRIRHEITRFCYRKGTILEGLFPILLMHKLLNDNT
jgi:hypothetical protein